MSSIGDELLAAYRATDYRVETVPELVLKIEGHSPGLAALYARWGVASAAFLTAWNPLSQPTSREKNLEQGARLLEDVRDLGLPYLEGRGCDPSGQWPPEESLLVLGLSRPLAMELGERYAQNAVVWADADAIPRLVLLRELR